eukprot:TRINITY_DN12255_c0_g2_i1.p1 TRINITY_DN12255_c0_g2~~TRINITY_DN12255_c0_g2_i1.p1  ORF type:complete len:126 (+),score=18.25 TRINITY_DN12255_c0_g2_i1:518-895(+)
MFWDKERIALNNVIKEHERTITKIEAILDEKENKIMRLAEEVETGCPLKICYNICAEDPAESAAELYKLREAKMNNDFLIYKLNEMEEDKGCISIQYINMQRMIEELENRIQHLQEDRTALKKQL